MRHNSRMDLVRGPICASLCATVLQAASISGVVVDSLTSRPLARALVTLRPIDPGKPITGRANHAGQFNLTAMAGQYLLTATRDGFAPYKYGQKDWQSAAKPVAVEQERPLALEIRMHRYGSISGTLLDENEVGIAGQRVLAYHARTPLEVAASAIADERGVYRFHGLEPGVYYVRSAAKELEDGSGLVPTFHRQTTALDQAGTASVALDQEAGDVDIHPEAGTLFRVKGKVSGPQHPARAKLTLISDTGRVKISSDENDQFEFADIAPGHYDLLAEGPEGGLAAIRPLVVDNDAEGVSIGLSPLPVVEFHMEDDKGRPVDATKIRLSGRRKDLDGPGDSQALKLTNNRVSLAPGNWEILTAPPVANYAAEFTAPAMRNADRKRADDWNELAVSGFTSIHVKLSTHPATLHGRVTDAEQNVVPGAPVYLEAFDPDTGKRIAELRSVTANSHGQYQFRGLPPGGYRILSSFEYDKPDSAAMDAAGAVTATLSEDKDTAQDLVLYVR